MEWWDALAARLLGETLLAPRLDTLPLILLSMHCFLPPRPLIPFRRTSSAALLSFDEKRLWDRIVLKESIVER